MQLLIVGDVMLGRLVNQALTSKPPDYPWGDSLSLFASTDLRICNLECVLSDRGRPWSATSKVVHFRSDAKNVAVLNAAKIDSVSIANNHALDYEYDALFEMLCLLERDGIAHAGAGRNRIEAWRPATLMCGTTRVVMIACTDNEPGWEATGGRAGICYVPTDLKDARAQELLRRVADVKQESDCLIVSCHWGPNWGYRPRASHIRFGRALVDAGADIVFGHSPHVFRGIELHRGRPILYSTGNFIDDYAVDEIERNDESSVFVLDLEKSVARGIRLYPTVIRNFQARMAGRETARRIAEKMRILCAELGTPSTWDSVQACLTITTSDAAERAA